MFANGPENWDLIPVRVLPKTQRKVLDAALLNTQHYNVKIEGKDEQSRERSSALSLTSMLWLLKKESSDCSRLRLPTLLTFTYLFTHIYIYIYILLYNCYFIFFQIIVIYR